MEQSDFGDNGRGSPPTNRSGCWYEKGNRKNWLLSIISPSRSHPRLQYSSNMFQAGRKGILSLSLHFRGGVTQPGQTWIGFPHQRLGCGSTAPPHGQIPGEGRTSLQAPLDKGSQGMTGRLGHERVVGFRIGPQSCCWVVWNIYAKLKKKKKLPLLG